MRYCSEGTDAARVDMHGVKQQDNADSTPSKHIVTACVLSRTSQASCMFQQTDHHMHARIRICVYFLTYWLASLDLLAKLQYNTILNDMRHGSLLV